MLAANSTYANPQHKFNSQRRNVHERVMAVRCDSPFALSLLLILPATLGAQTRPPITEKIAKTYGLDSWDKIEAIRYNFNAEGALKLSRTWVWEPKTNQVSYEGKDEAGKPVKLMYCALRLAARPNLTSQYTRKRRRIRLLVVTTDPASSHP